MASSFLELCARCRWHCCCCYCCQRPKEQSSETARKQIACRHSTPGDRSSEQLCWLRATPRCNVWSRMNRIRGSNSACTLIPSIRRCGRFQDPRKTQKQSDACIYPLTTTNAAHKSHISIRFKKSVCCCEWQSRDCSCSCRWRLFRGLRLPSGVRSRQSVGRSVG